MSQHNQIRQSVINDLSTEISDIKAWFNGYPAVIDVGDADTESELPAVAVYLDVGETTGQDFENEEWTATLHVEIFEHATNDLEPTLDAIAEQINQVIHRNYKVQNTLSECHRLGFAYTRDDVQPWGTLDLTFTINWEDD